MHINSCVCWLVARRDTVWCARSCPSAAKNPFIFLRASVWCECMCVSARYALNLLVHSNRAGLACAQKVYDKPLLIPPHTQLYEKSHQIAARGRALSS